MAQYVVRLTAAARAQLTEMISTGRRAASMLTRARMLLKADAHDAGPPWTDRTPRGSTGDQCRDRPSCPAGLRRRRA